MTLDREDIQAIASEVVLQLKPLLSMQAVVNPDPPEEGGMSDYDFAMLMASPNLEAAIAAREKKLRDERRAKAPRKRRAA